MDEHSHTQAQTPPEGATPHVHSPTLCGQCSKPMDSPVCCASCGALNALPPSMFTYFELFGLEPTFDLDLGLLRRKYLGLSRSIHPDVAGRSGDQVRRQSLDLSAGLNRAYDTLRDPAARAEYLLRLAGGPSAGDDKSVPGDLLAQVMMYREEIDEARESGDSSTLDVMRDQLTQGRDATLKTIAELCAPARLQNPDDRRALRVQLNAVKYWNNLLDQLPTAVSE